MAANQNWVKVGEYIRQVRESRNLSQFTLAEKAGVSQSAISRLELGANKKDDPGAVLLSSIALVLDLSLENLIDIARADALSAGSIKPTSLAAPVTTQPATGRDRLLELEGEVDTLGTQVASLQQGVGESRRLVATAVELLARELGLPAETILRIQAELQ